MPSLRPGYETPRRSRAESRFGSIDCLRERPGPGKRIAKEDPDERLVHNLEHGYIVMHHNCTVEECPAVVNGLKRIFGRYSTKIIVNYRPRTDAAIALAAWRRLEKMEEFDEQRIVEFIEAYRGGGVAPEASAP